MTTPEAIAADVAARYGVPVDPACVHIIPAGVSALPWDAPPEHWRAIIKRQTDEAKKGKA